MTNISQQELIQPVAVKRDVDGYWSHPGIPYGDEDLESAAAFTKWMADQGLIYKVSRLEDEDESHPAYHAYYEEGCSGVVGWNHEPPKDDRWFTLSIHDTEDGPVWVWVRRVENSEAA